MFERGWSVAHDAAGNAWVTGDINEVGTSVYDFPVLNPIQPGRGLRDGFVAQFGPAGDLLFSSYLGGTLSDQGRGIAVDGSGNAYVTGSTDSYNFPSQGGFQPANAGGLNNHDAFVLKLAPGTAQNAALASYTISASSVPAGGNAVGTITLTAAAPSTGANVILLTNSPVVNLAASVTIPAGRTSVSFGIGTQAPSSTTTATLDARYGGATLNAMLTVTVGSAPALSLVSANSSSVVGGSQVLGATRSPRAPAGGIQVALSTKSARLTLPASVLVPAGTSSATFATGSSTVPATTSANVVATYLGVSKSALVTLQTATVGDKVSITKAERKSGHLTVEATGSNASVRLTAFLPSGATLGTLPSSGGRFKPRSPWRADQPA